jgi:hypothetical protein
MYIEDILSALFWVFVGLLTIYGLVCFVDLIAPIAESRGSWWNLFYHILDAIS